MYQSYERKKESSYFWNLTGLMMFYQERAASLFFATLSLLAGLRQQSPSTHYASLHLAFRPFSLSYNPPPPSPVYKSCRWDRLTNSTRGEAGEEDNKKDYPSGGDKRRCRKRMRKVVVVMKRGRWRTAKAMTKRKAKIKKRRDPKGEGKGWLVG